jgi:CheY-like chemotaxis protein
MVVEDESDLLATVTMVLERHGYRVHGFPDPSLALTHIRDERCNDCKIILCDIKMPHLTGVELAVHLKRIRPDLKFLLMSAMPVDKEQWRRVLPQSENVDDFISKPFTTAELVDTVKKWETRS